MTCARPMPPSQYRQVKHFFQGVGIGGEPVVDQRQGLSHHLRPTSPPPGTIQISPRAPRLTASFNAYHNTGFASKYDRCQRHRSFRNRLLYPHISSSSTHYNLPSSGLTTSRTSRHRRRRLGNPANGRWPKFFCLRAVQGYDASW